jgi:mycothiol synthase
MMPYTFRNLDYGSDLPGLARLHAEVEAVDGEGRDVSEARLRERLRLPGHDPARDCWVVESIDEPGRLVGFAGVWRSPDEERADVTGVVHPDLRRKGIGRILIGRALVRARALGAVRADAYADSRNGAGNAFLREHGFLPVAAYTRMRAPGNREFEAPRWPAGFEVRTFDRVLDATLLANAMNESYDALWGHEPVTEAALTGQLREWPHDGIFLLFDSGGDVAGIVRAQVRRPPAGASGQPTGQVEAPGVIPWRRRQDLYRPLLLTAVRYVQAQRPAAIDLESWGDEDGTLETYARAGFALVRRSVAYRLNLR